MLYMHAKTLNFTLCAAYSVVYNVQSCMQDKNYSTVNYNYIHYCTLIMQESYIWCMTCTSWIHVHAHTYCMDLYNGTAKEGPMHAKCRSLQPHYTWSSRCSFQLKVVCAHLYVAGTVGTVLIRD